MVQYMNLKILKPMKLRNKESFINPRMYDNTNRTPPMDRETKRLSMTQASWRAAPKR